MVIKYDISEQAIVHKKQDAKYAISAIYQMLSLCAGEPLNLAYVQFEHEKPNSKVNYHDVFNCPVYFSAPSSKLALYSSELRLYRFNRDSRLYDVILKHLNDVKKIRAKSNFKERLSNLIFSQLSSGDVTANNMGDLLGLSV